MVPVTGLRPAILAAKARLHEQREKIRARHDKGAAGIQICTALVELFDSVIIDLYREALAETAAQGMPDLTDRIAVIAHGGYGRRDVAPYSDIDLMILHEREDADAVTAVAQRLLRDVFDVGLTLGQSLRTSDEACRLAAKDATICTSLIESRLLEGNQEMFDSFAAQFRKTVERRTRANLAAIEKARGEERSQFGETVYLLEPNLKRTRGGLRDLQMLRWVGYVKHGASEFDGLRLCGALSRADAVQLRSAWDFLLHLRNEMHFHSGKPHDVLDRAEQMRVAEVFGYHEMHGLLPVEIFMREYFRHTDAVSHIVARFTESAKGAPRWMTSFASLFSHHFEGDYLVGPKSISANEQGLKKLQTSVAEILRLAVVANLYNKPIAHATQEAIRAAAPELGDTIDEEASRRFISLLDHPARLGTLLRELYEMGVLEKIIPAFEHARSLLQFNDYHKYTVDEHSLRAVERATEFADDTGAAGWVYARIKRKWLLHLALLIHDLGKGFVEDHSMVGIGIATEVGARLRLSEADTESLRYLVGQHLTMSHLAFRRDTSDDQLIVRFAVDVGSPELLQMLFVLTCADLAAVGPGVLNAWKVEVLAGLYHRTLRHLAPDAPTFVTEQRSADIRREILAAMRVEGAEAAWFRKQLAALPPGYLKSTPAADVTASLRKWRALASGEVHAEGRYLPESRATEYSVSTHEDVTPGVFHKLCGALASRGLEILSAEINTLEEGLIFDRFFVLDPDFTEEPSAERMADVREALEASLRTDSKPPIFRKLWQANAQRTRLDLAPLPTRVKIDNTTSERYSVIDVFAADRTGLLYTITRTLFELELSVAVAKIGTYLDQVVDVFYVTDLSGEKIEDEVRQRAISERLLSAIDEFERQETGKAKAR